MKLYVIHAALGPAVLTGAENVRAAPTGFSLAALIFGPLWLLVRGAWLALFGYGLLASAVAGLVAFAGLRPVGAFGLFVLAQLYLAVEGRALAVAAQSRGGRPLVDVIFARSDLEAEKLYLERALKAAPSLPPRGVARADEGVIGLFPEPRR